VPCNSAAGRTASGLAGGARWLLKLGPGLGGHVGVAGARRAPRPHAGECCVEPSCHNLLCAHALQPSLSCPAPPTHRQRLNHFCGMLELARKRSMARALAALATAAAAAAAATTAAAAAAPPLPALEQLAAALPATLSAATQGSTMHPHRDPHPCGALDCMPATWLLPEQLSQCVSAARASGKQAAFIIKPDAGCQVCVGLGGWSPWGQPHASPKGLGTPNSAPTSHTWPTSHTLNI
jgi:hypothetical protein